MENKSLYGMNKNVNRYIFSFNDILKLSRELKSWKINTILNDVSKEKIINTKFCRLKKCIKTLKDHRDVISQTIQLSENILISCSWDRDIKIWDIEKSLCLHTLLNGHTDKVFTILLLQNGNLASGGDDKKMKIWDLKTNKCIKNIE